MKKLSLINFLFWINHPRTRQIENPPLSPFVKGRITTPPISKGRLGGIFFLTNSKGVSAIFLIVAMLLMVILAYVFSYLIPTKQKSVVYPIESTQAFFLAQSGVEFAVRLAKDNIWISKHSLNTNLNTAPNNTRTFGTGTFTLTYTSSSDTLTSVGYVPTGTQRREIGVSNFSQFVNYYAYYKTITVQAGKVTNGPLTSFPMLVSITDPNLINGAHIASYNCYAGSTNDPCDLVFLGMDDTTCGGTGMSPCKLSHEIEYYVSTTGQLVAWVNVPSINNLTTIRMYYGNPCMTASTQSPSGVWTNYSGVWHSGQAAMPLTDSTGNNNLTNATNPPTQVAGEIGYAQSYNGTTQYASKTAGVTANIPSPSASDTFSVWFTIGVADANTRSGVSFMNPNTTSGLQFGQRNSTVCFWQWGGGVLGGTHANPAVNTWHYMVYTFDGTTNRPYYDGAALGTGTTTPVAGAPTQIYFSTWNGAAEFWNGSIDEVRISNSGIVRTAGWIATEYSNQSNPGGIGAPGFYAVGAEQNGL